MRTRPKIFKSIITSMLALLVFGATYLLSYLIIGGIIQLLISIPIIKDLIGFLFYKRGDTPDMMLSMLAPAIAYFTTMTTQEAVNKDAPTRGLSCIILGICIMALHIISLVVNLISGNAIWKNIVQAIVGLLFFRSGRVELSDVNTDSPPIPTEKPKVVPEEKPVQPLHTPPTTATPVTLNQKTRAEEPTYFMRDYCGNLVKVPMSQLARWQAAQEQLKEQIPPPASITPPEFEDNDFDLDAFLADIKNDLY